MIEFFFQTDGVMVNIFLLVSAILDQKRLINSIDQRCALSIQKKICIDKVAIKLQHVRNWAVIGENNIALFFKCHMI